MLAMMVDLEDDDEWAMADELEDDDYDRYNLMTITMNGLLSLVHIDLCFIFFLYVAMR